MQASEQRPLPPLPEPLCKLDIGSGWITPTRGFTAEQMREYVRADRRAMGCRMGPRQQVPGEHETMTDRIETLRAVAMAATPGEWEWFTSNSTKRLSADGKDGSVLYAYRCSDGADDICISEANAAHIAAFNPKTALALLAVVEDVSGFWPELRQLLEAVKQDWTAQDCWSEWDESVFARSVAFTATLAALRAALEELEKMK